MPPNSRKRKVDDVEELDEDDRMSTSPCGSPSMQSSSLTIHHQKKRVRSNISGRPLSLPRLLETLDADALRTALQTICQRHPDIASEVVSSAPRPSVDAAVQILSRYEQNLRIAYPLTNNPGSDYSYNRVRRQLTQLFDVLYDFTPQFLPPLETQTWTSLNYLDGVTTIINRLPTWDTPQHNVEKQSAYDEISKAWVLVIREAAKRGGGINLQISGWDHKLSKHNLAAGGRLQEAVNELSANIGWIAGGSSNADDRASIRQQLLSGTYGSTSGVRVGPW